MSEPPPTEPYPSADELRRVGHRVVEWIARHLTELPDGPAFRPVPAEIAREIAEAPAPRRGAPADAILDEFEHAIGPFPFGNGHPRFWGWVNSPPEWIGVFAEALAAAMNPSCAGGNHAAIHLERRVHAWLRELVGFPESGGALLVSGGSMANLTALAAARHANAGFDVRTEGLQQGRAPLTVYASTEAHSCIVKAAELLGLGRSFVRQVPVDERLRMDVDALADLVARDRSKGLRPIAVVASAGTANTGAIDPLAPLAELCRREGVWFHVDGSYGAPAILSAAYRDELAPISRADSLAIDPHKWLSVPVEAGAVLVRDPATLRDAFRLVPAYVGTQAADTANPVVGSAWFSEYGFQQTRAFRALKLWMCLRHVGWEGYARRIEADLERARELERRVIEASDLELLAPRGLSIVCFRHVPAELREHPAELDEHNRALLLRVQLRGDAFLSGTTVSGAFALRACFVNHRTGAHDLDVLFEALGREGRALRADA